MHSIPHRNAYLHRIIHQHLSQVLSDYRLIPNAHAILWYHTPALKPTLAGITVLKFLPSEWSPDSDTGPFSRQETQNGRPSRMARCSPAGRCHTAKWCPGIWSASLRSIWVRKLPSYIPFAAVKVLFPLSSLGRQCHPYGSLFVIVLFLSYFCGKVSNSYFS